MKPRVAVIGTGGTISSMGTGPLDILDYLANGTVLDVNGLLARIPEAALVADIVPVPFRAIPSTQLAWPEWKELLGLCHKLAGEDPQLTGIVITHGTASLEETAYFLSLTLKIAIPVVLVGAQRPASALSGDGPMNIVNAIRVAADPGGARCDENLHTPHANLPHRGFRGAWPCGWRYDCLVPQAHSQDRARYGI
jgi:L-asparaginase